MKKSFVLVMVFTALLAMGLIVSGCSSTSASSNSTPVITAIAAEHNTIYPVGNTRITCNATSKNGDTLNYQWISNDGTITGTGPTITWEAPKTYGDFHIMCSVLDNHGNKTSQTVTVTVIVRDPATCCR